jgi:xylulokinase
LETELVMVNTSEGAAYGAALLAGVGVKNWDSVAVACTASIRITHRIEGEAKQANVYRKSYAIYKDLYPALRASFHAVNAL